MKQYIRAFKMWLRGNLSYGDCLHIVKHYTIYRLR